MINILMGKSASGKDTLMRKLLKEGYTPIVSHTTRPMREGEKEGREYVFLTREEFLSNREKGVYMETRSYDTTVGGVPDTWYYGSPKVDPTTKNWLTIVDLDGAAEYVRVYGKENVRVTFLAVPDEERERRARKRGSFDQTEWERRLKDDRVKFAPERIRALEQIVSVETILNV